jgi:hypothetical protein
MAAPAATRITPATSSARSPAAAPILAPSSSPARDMTTLTTPNTAAATPTPTW